MISRYQRKALITANITTMKKIGDDPRPDHDNYTGNDGDDSSQQSTHLDESQIDTSLSLPGMNTKHNMLYILDMDEETSYMLHTAS
jgi:hypothetical protein